MADGDDDRAALERQVVELVRRMSELEARLAEVEGRPAATSAASPDVARSIGSNPAEFAWPEGVRPVPPPAGAPFPPPAAPQPPAGAPFQPPAASFQPPAAPLQPPAGTPPTAQDP
jgi:hypothetical protein